MSYSLSVTVCGKFFLLVFFLLSLSINESRSQSNPIPLVPDLTVEQVVKVPPDCSRLAIDPVSHQLFYTVLDGDLHRVNIGGGVPDDTLLFSVNDHHIQFLQGMVFYDSLLYVVGDIPEGDQTRGMVARGKLQPDGNRQWDTVMYTAPYPLGNTFFDHGFSGITINADGSRLYINSGARTDHGEEQNNDGLFPGAREVPLTSAIFEINADTQDLFLPGDSASVAPFLFCDGVRNSFDLAFSPSGDLFGCENSGDRDDPDELNWLQQNHHYGFPWILGGDFNPMQFPGYNPDSDVMLNKHRYAYTHGFFHDDSLFPPIPSNITFTSAIQNLGPDADFYRDSSDALVKDASVTGHVLTSFTPHRAPLGIVFDYANKLDSPYTGEAFMLGFQRRGDSTGYSADGAGTLLDSSEDLLHVHLFFDGTGYKMNCTRIVGRFNHPVDACLDGNIMYVIENSTNDSANIWKITFPEISGNPTINTGGGMISLSPNPLNQSATLSIRSTISEQCVINIFDQLGKKVQTMPVVQLKQGYNLLHIRMKNLPNGYYILEAQTLSQIFTIGFLKE